MADVPGLTRRFSARVTRALPVWLLGYLALHGLEQAAVCTGRDALLARLASTAHARLEAFCVIVPAAVYLFARPQLQRGPWPRGFRAVHMISGSVAAALLALHLMQVWWPRVRTSAPSAAYVAMLEVTSTPAGAALQLLFVTACLLHLGLAIVPGLQGVGLSMRGASSLAAWVCAALWLWLVNLLSAYVAGSPLL